MTLRGIAIFSVCLFCASCFDSKSTDLIREDKNSSLTKNLQNKGSEEKLDPELVHLLGQEQHIIQPFAWESRDGQEGSVVGINQEGKLIRVRFANEAGKYVLKEVAPYSLKEYENTLLEKSGSLEIKNYLTDREFPFKSDVVSLEHCQIHFVLVHQALNRSLKGSSLTLTDIRLRVIIQRDSQEISTFQEGPLSLTTEETLVADINGDGKQEYVFIGSDMSMSIHIWTTNLDCTVKRINFKQGSDLAESEENKEILLEKNNSTGIYSVHSKDYVVLRKNGQSFWNITEIIYYWDGKESVYRAGKTVHRLEPIKT